MTSMLIIFQACGNSTEKSVKDGDKSVKTETSSVNQLSGVYVCTEHWNSELKGGLKMTFKDGKVSLAGVSNAGYRVEGDSLFIDMHSHEMGFKIEGNNLIAEGAAGKVVYSKE